MYVRLGRRVRVGMKTADGARGDRVVVSLHRVHLVVSEWEHVFHPGSIEVFSGR